MLVKDSTELRTLYSCQSVCDFFVDCFMVKYGRIEQKFKPIIEKKCDEGLSFKGLVNNNELLGWQKILRGA